MASALAADAAIQKKIFGSGKTALIISNEEIKDTMKIVKSREESRLLVEGIVKQLKMKRNNKMQEFSECY